MPEQKEKAAPASPQSGLPEKSGALTATPAENKQTEQPPAAAAAKPALRAGEKLFTVILCLAGFLLFGQALQLWLRLSPPRNASAAALPLFVSGLWALLALSIVIENRRRLSPLSALRPWPQKLKAGLHYALPRPVFVMLLLVLVYCILLWLRLSFFVATPLFLYAAMCYFRRGDYLKNLLWTALVMLFIVVIFRFLFGIVFP